MKKTGGHKIDTVFVLIIFCVFAMSVLLVLALGASIYGSMTEITRDGQDERTTLSYIWTKIKNSDGADGVYVGDFNGLTALFFDEEIDGVEYQTAIYHYDGYLRELFGEKGIGLLPEDGESVLRIESLTFEEAGHGMIKAVAGEESLLITPRGGSAEGVSAGGAAEGGSPE